MKKYRKKPVVVEARKFDKAKWNEEISKAKLSDTYPMVLLDVNPIMENPWEKFKLDVKPVIETLEGYMEVSDGDYIIKGVQGEFYPCKPDIFAATYDVCD